jgi:predicted Zn-dependent protease
MAGRRPVLRRFFGSITSGRDTAAGPTWPAVLFLCLQIASPSGSASSARSDQVVQVDDTTLEYARGAFAAMLRKHPAYGDAAIQRYVQSIGARLVAAAPPIDVPLSFTVLDSPGIFAYSFAHGAVVVSRGLLAHLNTEAQLAAVLGHEIGHIVSRHQALGIQEALKVQELGEKLARRFPGAQARDAIRALSFAKVRGYSREHEIEADVWSERLLAPAGYDSAVSGQALRVFLKHDEFWDRFGFELWEIPEFFGGDGVFATHPSTPARVELALERVGARVLEAPAPDPRYLAALRGMLFGLPERHGIQRGSRYLHPLHHVAFTVPQNWYLFASDERLIAAPRGKDGLVMMWLSPLVAGVTRRAALGELARGQSISPTILNIGNTVEGETAVFSLPGESSPRTARIAVFDLKHSRVSMIGFAFAKENWQATDTQLLALIRSLHDATPAETRVAIPMRIQVERARVDRPLVVEEQPFSDLPRERWEMLNQLFPAEPVATGRWIKIVR